MGGNGEQWAALGSTKNKDFLSQSTLSSAVRNPDFVLAADQGFLSLRQTIGRSDYAVFHHGFAKIQQIPEPQAGELKIRQKLFLMGIVDALN